MTLIERLQSDPHAADWEALYQLYWRPVYVFTKANTTLAHEDCEDIVQEVFIKLIRGGIAKFDPKRARRQDRARFRTWMVFLTRSTRSAWFKRRKRRPEGYPAGDDETLLENISNEHEVKFWEIGLTATALERLQRMVSPTKYEAFRLHALEGRTVKEVGRRLRISPNTVFVYKSEMIKAIKNEIQAIEDETGDAKKDERRRQ